MPIGSYVTAARPGKVTEIRNANPDGVDLILGNENLVKALKTDSLRERINRDLRALPRVT